jgi:serine protein kinase
MTPEKDRTSLYRLSVDGELDPRSKKFMQELLTRYDGDWGKVVENHIRAVRKVHSEADRCGIATFQPKDEKNQDSTELTGDINWGKLPHFGTDSDPRAFNFDGEFCVGSRGIVEFIEVLKLAKEFLYDLLGASQEKQIKPKKFPQIAVDTVLVGHTNSPEFLKLKSDQTMEALRDRTVKIDVPYLLRWSDELKVLESQYSGGKIKQHIAPHTLEIAALWTVLTRLQDDKDGKISLVEKAKLYDGKSLPGWTEDSVKEMRDKYPDEGMTGVSCRYTQDKISNCLSSHYDYINFFMVLNELKAGIDHQSLLNNQEDKAKYVACIDLAKKELDEILKTEVQKALVGDEHAIERLCGNYIDNVMAYINGTKIKNPFTEQDQEPDERLMRSIEEKIEIPEVGADDFRRMLAGFIGHLAHSGKQFQWDSNPQLKKALESKLFEDTKDHIKLSALNIKGATVVDKEIQEKIDAVKKRLISQYGYNEQSATDVLEYISSIFARGDVSED